MVQHALSPFFACAVVSHSWMRLKGFTCNALFLAIPRRAAECRCRPWRTAARAMDSAALRSDAPLRAACPRLPMGGMAQVHRTELQRHAIQPAAPWPRDVWPARSTAAWHPKPQCVTPRAMTPPRALDRVLLRPGLTTTESCYGSRSLGSATQPRDPARERPSRVVSSPRAPTPRGTQSRGA